MTHTLFITNDFPPRPGGIQTFVYEIVRRFDPESITVLTSDWIDAKSFDAQQPYEVIRSKYKVLLPTSETFKLARKIIIGKNVTRVVFGAAAPLGLLANQIRELGVEKIVAFTHGHEAGWAKTPVTKQLLKKIGNDVDVLTYLTEYTRREISKGLSDQAISNMRQLLPAVDSELFNPENKNRGDLLRKQAGFANRPVLISVSRLMARKGHDVLINALPKLKSEIPGLALIIVGDGNYRDHLSKLISRQGLESDVYLTGKVPFVDLPAWYAAGDVFAMPCRTRMGGWDVEGLGIVYLEASATGLPVIAGDSGGAPEAVAQGKSGYVVSGEDDSELINRIIDLFKAEKLRAEMGSFGREWILENWTWDKSVNRLMLLLDGTDPDR